MSEAAGPTPPQPCQGDGPVLRQTLRVTALADGLVTLEGQRATGCVNCAVKSGCGTSVLAEMMGRAQTVSVPQSLPLAIGDPVVLAMDRRAFLGAALRAYLLPPAALVATATLAQMFGGSDALTALLCLPVLALAFLPLLCADRRGLSKASLWLEPVPER